MAKALQAPGPFLAILLEKYKLNPFKLSKDIHLSQSAVRLITIGKTKITVPVALRLAKYFNTNPEFWLAMQMKWDIAEANHNKALMKIIKSVSRVSKGAAGGTAKKTAAAKKPGAKKKVTASKKKAAGAKRPAAKKKAVAAKKSTVKKSTARKSVARKRVVASKKPLSRKKTVAARKKAPVKAGKKPAVRRGRPAKKR